MWVCPPGPASVTEIESCTAVGLTAATRSASRPSPLTSRSRAPAGDDGRAHSSIVSSGSAASATGHAT